MPTIFNLGSINKDQTLRVKRLPAPGETIMGEVAGTSLGGKGMNVSIALKRAGFDPVHIGAVNRGDVSVLASIEGYGIATGQIEPSELETGQAFIFLDDDHENAIVVCPGANHAIGEAHIDAALSHGRAGDWLVLQNETNGQAFAIKQARELGMRVAYMAAPFDEEVTAGLLGEVDLLAVNETEWSQLVTYLGGDPSLVQVPRVLITRGAQGATFLEQSVEFAVSGLTVTVKDTTAAGDTFFGFFLAEYIRTGDARQSLTYANAAAALAVQAEGAAVSIPTHADVQQFKETVYPS